MDDIDNEIWCSDCNTAIHDGEEHECYIMDNKDDYTEKLIAEVFVRESLWNSSLPYKLRGSTTIKALWTEIDACLGTVAGTSQVKWKNLRDRFVKEHHIQTAYIRSSSAAIKKECSWSLYETLRFLIPTIDYRKTESNLENIYLTKSNVEDIQLSLPSKTNLSTSNIKENINILQPIQKQQISLLQSQSVRSQRNYSPSLCSSTSDDSTSPNITITSRRPLKRNINTESKHMASEESNFSLPSKYRKFLNTPSSLCLP